MSNPPEIRVPQARYSLLTTERKSFFRCNKFTIISVIFALITIFILATYVLVGLYEHIFNNKNNLNEGFPSTWLHRANFYNSFDYDKLNLTDQSFTISRNVVTSSSTETFKLVCYYSFPSSNSTDTSTRSLLPQKVDPNLCTHIILAFASVVNNSIYLDDWQKNVSKAVVNLKEENKDLKVLLSVGGAGNEGGFPEMVLNHENRKSFIRSIDQYMRDFKLDGVDLDWEFPNEILGDDKRQKIHFTQLLREIRAEINRQDRHKFLLSVAVAAPTFLIDNCYDVSYMNEYVDFINLMSYDYHFYTKFTPFTGFNSPLYAQTGQIGYFSELNINYSANYWHIRGMDRSKIVVGLPTYGHSFRLLNTVNHGIGAPASGYGNIGSIGFVDFNDVCTFLSKPQVKRVFDMDTKSPYAYKYREWISFDDQTSLTYKAEYITNNNFGGAMILSLNTDDHRGTCKINGPPARFPLTKVIKSILNDRQL